MSLLKSKARQVDRYERYFVKEIDTSGPFFYPARKRKIVQYDDRMSVVHDKLKDHSLNFHFSLSGLSGTTFNLLNPLIY